MDHLETLEPHALHRLDPDRAPGPGMTLTRDRIGDELVLRKSARGGQRAALRREAEVLRALGGHGVVRLIELVDGADVTELVLLDTGGPSLAAALADPATDSRSALRLLADACDAVSRLHEQGWAHGDLRADHVLLTRRHHIRLCSLGDAVTLDTEPDAGRADRVALLRIVDDWTRSAGTDGSPMSSRIRSRVLARRTHRLPDDPDGAAARGRRRDERGALHLHALHAAVQHPRLGLGDDPRRPHVVGPRRRDGPRRGARVGGDAGGAAGGGVTR